MKIFISPFKSDEEAKRVIDTESDVGICGWYLDNSSNIARPLREPEFPHAFLEGEHSREGLLAYLHLYPADKEAEDKAVLESLHHAGEYETIGESWIPNWDTDCIRLDGTFTPNQLLALLHFYRKE
jgi:hypothetical protein